MSATGLNNCGRERFDLDQEALRPWFPLPRVLDGLFGLCERLFGIRIEAADGEAPVWHEDVRFFRVLDRDHAPLPPSTSTRSAVLPASVAAPG